MKRPAHVFISPFRWSVKWGKAEVLKHHPNGDACGSCDMASLTIAIDGGRAEDYAKAILLHEILHACVRSSDPTLDDDAEETAVAAITSPLLAMLRQNPDVVAFLVDQS